MTWSPPEAPDDDAERLAIVLAPLMVERITTLLGLRVMTVRDRELVQAMARRDPRTLTPDHRHWVQQLLWRYRRALAADIAPKLNPDDPIVREMEKTGA